MKVIEEWMKLTVNKYDDGAYEAYEALGDERIESKNWADIAQWVKDEVDRISEEIEK